jgi:HSP20 family molecular chaperone IbpA
MAAHETVGATDLHYGRVLRPSSGYDFYLVRMRRAWRPPTDVYETEQHVVIRVEVAGMREEDFEISLADRRLAIMGHRADPAEKLSYQNMEIQYGDFRTEVLLSWNVGRDAIEATYEQGFLSVRIPKAIERRIQVRVTGGEPPQGDRPTD